jgi:hypothetical protein
MPTQIITTRFASLARKFGAKDWRVWAMAAGVVVLLAGSFFAFPSARKAAPPAAPPAASPATPSTGAPTLPSALPPAVVMARPITPPEPPSKCPRLDSAAATRTLSLLVDSIRAQKPGSRLAVNYDVCGLEKGAAFTTDITLRKTDQSRLRLMVGATVKPMTSTYPDAAIGPRTRRRRTISLSGLPSGMYSVNVRIVDAKSRRREKARQFQLLEN